MVATTPAVQRTRVYTLAKQLGATSAELLVFLREHHIADVSSASASLLAEDATRARIMWETEHTHPENNDAPAAEDTPGQTPAAETTPTAVSADDDSVGDDQQEETLLGNAIRSAEKTVRVEETDTVNTQDEKQPAQSVEQKTKPKKGKKTDKKTNKKPSKKNKTSAKAKRTVKEDKNKKVQDKKSSKKRAAKKTKREKSRKK